jgi:hypothetical protein
MLKDYLLIRDNGLVLHFSLQGSIFGASDHLSNKRSNAFMPGALECKNILISMIISSKVQPQIKNMWIIVIIKLSNLPGVIQ